MHMYIYIYIYIILYYIIYISIYIYIYNTYDAGPEPPPSPPHSGVSHPAALPCGVVSVVLLGLLDSRRHCLPPPCGGGSGVRGLLRYAGTLVLSPSLNLSAPACHQAEAAILADLSHALLLYLHWIGCSAAGKPTKVFLQLFVSSCIVILIAIATTLEVAFCFPLSVGGAYVAVVQPSLWCARGALV